MQMLAFDQTAEALILAAVIRPAGSPASCSIFGCADRARVVLNGKRACGQRHLALLLRATVHEEQVLGAKQHLRCKTVMPLGEILLRNGAVTERALTDALRTQEATGAGRIGAWLRQQTGLSETALTAALATQQGGPVLSLDGWNAVKAAPLAPRTLLERFGGIPIGFRGSPRRIIVGFEDKSSPELLRALERMHGCPAFPGVLAATAFWQTARELFAVRVPDPLVNEPASLTDLADSCSRLLLQAETKEAALAVLHDTVWLRFAPGGSRETQDLLYTVAGTVDHTGKI